MAKNFYNNEQWEVTANRTHDMRNIQRVGFCSSVNGSFETIWGEGGMYEFRTSATTMTISSDDANDANPSGTGLRTVLIDGLDSNYNSISEVVALNGLSGVSTTNSYLRINDIIGLTVGSTDTNAGNVYLGTGTITTGKPAVVDAKIDIDFGKSMMAIYTVPANHNGFFQRITVDSSRSGTGNLDVRGLFRPGGPGTAWLTGNYFPIFQNNIDLTLFFPQAIPEMTDIQIQAKISTGSTPVGCLFEILEQGSMG